LCGCPDPICPAGSISTTHEIFATGPHSENPTFQDLGKLEGSFEPYRIERREYWGAYTN